MHEMKCRSTKQPATAAQRAKTRRCFHRARKGGEREREREREIRTTSIFIRSRVCIQ